jgi:PKD repeat protein
MGPEHYVEFVNSVVAAYSRASLSKVGPQVELSTFTGGTGVCDPQIKYDPQTERWFYVAIRCDGTTTANTLYVGFSKTTDPTSFSTKAGGGWCGYEYGFGAAFEDYPKLGLDSVHILIGTNSFPSTGSGFFTAHIFSSPKPVKGVIGACPAAPALTTFGSSGAPLMTSIAHKASTPEPATVADNSQGGYVVAADEVSAFSGAGKNIMIWRVAGAAATPELLALGAPAVSSFELPADVLQSSSDPIDSSDSRLTQAVAAVDPTIEGSPETVWTQHTVAGGAGSVVRWYELVPSTVAVRQLGTISDPSSYVFNGAIAPTLSGGAVIDYDTGSSSALVQLMAQSRVGTAPLGTMNTPISLGSSSAIDSDFSCPSQPFGKKLGTVSCRWGDYAGASVDPTNGNVVWGSSQVNGPMGALITGAGHEAQWATTNFALGANDLAPTASFTVSASPRPGAPVVFNGGGSSDVDGAIASYSWNFGDGSVGAGPTPSHTYVSPGSYTVTLTITDSGGVTSAISQVVTVSAAAVESTILTTISTTTTSTTSTIPSLITPNSSFGPGEPAFNQTNGGITLTQTVSDPGTFRWLLTFQNGKFGVFSASNHKCKAGFVWLGRKCRPSKIIFAKGSLAVAGGGTVTLKLKPSASALKALKNALKQRKGLPVTITLTFQSARGGSPVSHTRAMTVKLKKR